MAVAYIYVLIVMVDSKIDLIGVCFLKFHRLDEVVYRRSCIRCNIGSIYIYNCNTHPESILIWMHLYLWRTIAQSLKCYLIPITRQKYYNVGMCSANALSPLKLSVTVFFIII